MMIAAYTFESAEALSAFCARHSIAGSDTYSVVQSDTSTWTDGLLYDHFRLTLVLDMDKIDLEHIREREEAHEVAERSKERQRTARIAEEEKRWAEETAASEGLLFREEGGA